MKKIAVSFAVFAFFVSFLFSSESKDNYSYSYARLSYVKGDVFIQRAADLGYEEGVVNLPVVEGDKLGTKEGRAEIHLGRKNYLRVDSSTQVDFVQLPKRDHDQIKLHLLSGSIYLRISFLVEEKSFEVHTPDASFYILDVGLYRLNVRENLETEIFVYDGAVEAAGEEGSLLVKEEQRLIASKGLFPSGTTHFDTSLDDSFRQWNDYRDSLLKRRVRRAYLPPELYEYEAELAYNGRWVYEAPHGYVWVPYVTHYQWRPYYYGRWVWYPIIGWTWVSHDPWGWCVYHYGRWHWRLGLGWYWIPTRIWGPAWVHWYWGYDYIGWCPLSFWGYPVVIINNYFYGRYYSTYYPRHSRAITVVRKNQLQAPRISGVALKQSQVNRLKKISLSSRKPGIRPVIKKISKNSLAVRTLSRENIRKVGKGYASGKTLISSSRLKSSVSRSSSQVSKSSILNKARTLSKRTIKSSTSSKTSRLTSKYSSSSSLRKSQISKTPSSLSRSSPTPSAIKIYPSRRTSSSSRSTPSSPSIKSPSRRSSSSYRSSSVSSERSAVKIYKPSSSSYRRYSSSRSDVSQEKKSPTRSYRQSSYSSRGSVSRRYSSSYGSYTTSPRSYSRSSSSSRYISPGSNYISSRSSSLRSSTTPRRSYSRNISSPKRSYSSSRSTAFRSSSSRSTISRSSSSRSSSSRTSSSRSSRGSIRKK